MGKGGGWGDEVPSLRNVVCVIGQLKRSEAEQTPREKLNLLRTRLDKDKSVIT